jgi:hypothetical protein
MIEVLESRIAPAAANLNLADLNGANGLKLNLDAPFQGRTSVSGAGDVNGDGFDDVIVSDYLARFSGFTVSYVIFGSASGISENFNLSQLDGSNGFTISGDANNFANAPANAAGDVNGDGFDDIIIGSRLTDGAGDNYIVFGKMSGFASNLSLSALDGSNGFKLTGGSGSVSSAGDINGDGFDDVIIGAYLAGENRSNSGASYVFFGKATGFQASTDLATLYGGNGFKISGAAAGDRFGRSVSAAGDINGDGFDDVVIGAPRTGSLSIPGASYLVFGKAIGFPADLNVSTLDGSNGFKLIGAGASDYSGFDVGGAGDVNGDGFDDIIIAGRRSLTNDPYSGFGATYVVFGKALGFTANLNLTALDGSNGFKLSGAHALGSQGRSISGGGDINGDGFDDIIIGAPFIDEYNGGAYVVFGKANGFKEKMNLSALDGSNGFKLSGDRKGDLAGFSVSAAGDFNNDGFHDLVISTAPTKFTLRPNTSYVVFGFDSRLTAKSDSSSIAFEDVDGDVVTIKVGRGEIVPQDVVIGPDGQLQLLKLSQAADRFEGATLKITAKKGAEGDGFVNVGAIDAAGLNLAKVVVKGDVGQIDVGTESLSKAALKSLTVRSLGVLGDSTQIPGTVDPLLSEIAGSLPKFTVKMDVKNAVVDVTGQVGAVKIGGNLTGDADAGAAVLRSLAEWGRIVPRVAGGIPGSVQAGNIDSFSLKGFMNGGSVQSAGDIGSVSIGNGIMGGAVAADGRIPVVKVLGGLTSDDAARPAVVAALARLGATRPKDAVAIDSMLVRGDVENARVLLGYNKEEVAKNPDASAGSVVVKGNWTATSLVAGVFDATADGFGLNDTPVAGDTTPSIVARIASVVIKGTATGSATEGDHFGITAQEIGKLSIAGEKVALSKTGMDDILLDPVNGDFRVVEL